MFSNEDTLGEAIKNESINITTEKSQKLTGWVKRWFGFFVFNGISTFFRLFNAKAILLEEQ